MKKLLAILLVVFATQLHAAYTYNLANCSQDAFEDAYYRGTVGGVFVKYIENGDTIQLPAGSGTWGANNRGNNGIIYITHTITIRGMGDSTVITMDETGATYASAVIALWANDVIVRDLKFKSASTRPVTTIGIGGNGIRITNVTYEGQADTIANDGQNGSGYFVFSGGYTGTLIDHCRINTPLGDHEWVFTRGPSNAYQSDSYIGTSQQDVFVEDCTITNTGYSDANANGRQVWRFNTITGIVKLDAHGSASNYPARSFRSVEYYNNTWSSGSMTAAAAMEIRGGTAMVFNNTASTGHIYLRDYLYDNAWPNWGHYNVTITSGTPTTITTQSPHGYQTGWIVYVDCAAQNIVGYFPITKVSDTVFSVVRPEATNGVGWNVRRLYTAYDYPLPDQVGAGKDGGAREPAYLWGNVRGGSPWPRALASPSAAAQDQYAAQTGTPGATFIERDVIAPNRDFFASSGFDTAVGVNVGTRSQMDAYTPSVTGYGWWVTNEGSWNTKLPANTSGRLYKWNGSSWVLFYTPYTYPHPLQNSTECSIPEPTPGANSYELPQSVQLSTAPAGSTIRYTTDGSTPSSTVGTVYTGAISITGNTNLKAIAYKSGLTDSPVLDVNYYITYATVAPTSSVTTGSYHGAQSVLLTSNTSGASIYYTTNGTTPTTSSTLYTGALTISETTTLKAMAHRDDLDDSGVLVVDITILNEVGNWQVVGTEQGVSGGWDRFGYFQFTSPITGNMAVVSVYGSNTSATNDITFALYEDTNGDHSLLTKVSTSAHSNVGTWATTWKDFSVSFAVVSGHKYWLFMHQSEGNSLYLWGNYNGGQEDRWVAYVPYETAWPSTIGATTNRDGWRMNIKGQLYPEGEGPNQASTPSMSHAASVYSASFNLTLTTTTAGASIYYTTDGSTPTTSSTLYTAPIPIEMGGIGTTVRTIKAIAVKAAMVDSAVVSRSFSMFIPPPGVNYQELSVGTLVFSSP